ncbi:group 10 secretory phospholipase A2 [Synchiropus splendidus]|uniref:group 10 secretory phospholipase A2 n=1 Tax=Synchiropus splendidus TaxID=270530 RepID=UPI00237E5B8D|nr:group 10 secretory phospholipase A2 [Synchiropus splendidus]
MTMFHWMLLILSVSAAAQRPHRSKRGLLELAGAIKCSTGRFPLVYAFYGCYCGLGGRGRPLDRADWCCHKHDCCYGDADALGCKTKTDRYQWKCDDQKAECDDLEDRCEKLLCQCDREAAKCLQKAPLNKKYVLWPDVLCRDEEVNCNIY